MNRMVIRLVNAALVVLCCFLAARILAAVAGEALVPLEAGGPGAAPRGEPPRRSWQDRQVVLDRNLFNVSTLAPTPDEVELEPDEDLEKTRLPLRLIATAAASNAERSRAAVEDLETREHLVLAVGDPVKDAQVLRIERRRLVLLNRGQREELAFEEDGSVAPRPTAARRTPPVRRSAAARARESRRNIQKLGENRFSINDDVIEDAAENPAALFSQARILPKYEDGEMVGVQLNAIKPGSLFEQIGIQNGDTVSALNGIEVTGQQESAEVLRELTQATEFNVTVIGPDGEVREMTYVRGQD